MFRYSPYRIVLFLILRSLAFTTVLGSQNAMAHENKKGFRLLGHEPDRTRLIMGIWSLHPYQPDFPIPTYNSGIGFASSQYFVATLINSYFDRAYSFGIERYWYDGTVGFLDYGFGYRMGLVTGYDERLLAVGNFAPVLPYGGIVAWADIGPIGVDVFYVYRAITVEAAFRFR